MTYYLKFGAVSTSPATRYAAAMLGFDTVIYSGRENIFKVL